MTRPGSTTPAPVAIGWDIGGAHVKACRIEGGLVTDIVQWPCPLWQGLAQLDDVLQLALRRWPESAPRSGGDGPRHVVTMTGEMVDLFVDRRDGVVQLSGRLADALGTVWLYAGPGLGDPRLDRSACWVGVDAAVAHWDAIASANWRATAQWLARCFERALLVDIGSTTTDLIWAGAAAPTGERRSDADRLVSGELVYQGVVRTPLCALTQQVPFRGRPSGVMNEWFATTADIYRLLGELEPAHDQQPTADNGAKDLPATRRRLARMIGRDAADGSDVDWQRLALHWRAAQRGLLLAALDRVLATAPSDAAATLVLAGCGDFLLADAARERSLALCRFADTVPYVDATTAQALRGWAQVCAPAVAVALLAGQAVPAPNHNPIDRAQSATNRDQGDNDVGRQDRRQPRA